MLAGGDLVLNPMLGGMNPHDFNSIAFDYMIWHNGTGRSYIKPFGWADTERNIWNAKHDFIERFFKIILSLTNKWNRD